MKMRILSILLILALALTGCAADAPAEEVIEQPAEEISAETEAESVPEEPVEEEPSFRTIALDYDGAGREYVFTGETLDGQTVDSAELFAGAKVTMLNIWGTFCPPCLMEMPDLGQIADDYAEADFQIVGLIHDVTSADSSTGELAVEQIAETGADYTHLIATNDVIQNVLFDVYAVPTTLFLDSEGKLLCSPVVGSNPYGTWAAAIDELLAR